MKSDEAGAYGVMWRLTGSLIYDPNNNTIISCRSSVRNKPDLKNIAFPKDINKETIYPSGDILRITNGDGFVVCRKFPNTLHKNSKLKLECNSQQCYYARVPARLIQDHINKAVERVHKWQRDREGKKSVLGKFWKKWWCDLMILIALLPTNSPLLISIDPFFASTECHKHAVDAVVAMEDCRREANVDFHKSETKSEYAQMLRHLFKNRQRPRFRDRRLEANVQRQLPQL